MPWFVSLSRLVMVGTVSSWFLGGLSFENVAGHWVLLMQNDSLDYIKNVWLLMPWFVSLSCLVMVGTVSSWIFGGLGHLETTCFGSTRPSCIYSANLGIFQAKQPGATPQQQLL